MRIYVASKFENQTRVKDIVSLLEGAGHTITYKWWENSQVTTTQARADMVGVITAEALVLIVEEDLKYCGAIAEFGMALACGIPVYVLGHQLDQRCIFMRLPEIRHGIRDLLEPSQA